MFEREKKKYVFTLLASNYYIRYVPNKLNKYVYDYYEVMNKYVTRTREKKCINICCWIRNFHRVSQRKLFLYAMKNYHCRLMGPGPSMQAAAASIAVILF